jgi:hypothetical protein
MITPLAIFMIMGYGWSWSDIITLHNLFSQVARSRNARYLATSCSDRICAVQQVLHGQLRGLKSAFGTVDQSRNNIGIITQSLRHTQPGGRACHEIHTLFCLSRHFHSFSWHSHFLSCRRTFPPSCPRWYKPQEVDQASRIIPHIQRCHSRIASGREQH